MEFKDLINSSILAGICIFGLLSFAFIFQANNNAQVSLSNNSLINSSFGQLQGNLTDSYATTSSQKENFEKEQPTIGTDSFIFTTIISTGTKVTSIMVNMLNILTKLIGQTLGISPVIIYGIIAIITITIIFLAWRVYKQG